MEKITPRLNSILDNPFIVGGTVRDIIMGKEINNINFACQLGHNEIEERLKKLGLHTWKIEKDHVVVATKINEKKIEIASFSDDIESELARKDFTVNAMAYRDGKIIDPFNGMADINKHILRTNGPAKERFAEDPLRMLKAVRFVSTHSFYIDQSAKDAIIEYAQSILCTSKDRWFYELNQLLLGSNVKSALELFYKTRLLGFILPELYPVTMFNRDQKHLTKDLWYHTKVVVGKSKATPTVRWAALLHDIAKPQTLCENQGTHFLQHDFLGSELANASLIRLRADKNLRLSVCGLISLHHRVGAVITSKNKVSINALRRLIRDCKERHCEIDDLIELFYADCSSSKTQTLKKQKSYTKWIVDSLANVREEDRKPKLPKNIGKEIIAYFNLSPGPVVGEIKNKLLSLLISGEISLDMDHREMFRKINMEE